MKHPFLLLLALAATTGAAADRPAERTVVAGPRYKAPALRQKLLGSGYRDIWTTPLRVPVFDVSGMKVQQRTPGKGRQTRSLRFKDAEGREWKVRSVDKDPTSALPEGLEDSIVDDIAQDVTSSQMPGAPLVANALARAAGIHHVPARLAVLPDDPALGQYRKDFAGMLGYVEEDLGVKGPVTRGFEQYAGGEHEGDTVELWKRLEEHPEESVDTRAFLRARLLDLLMGDWDRHKDQWEWVRRAGSQQWEPVPVDRDMAFSRYGGLLLGLVHSKVPRLTSFDPDYPGIRGLAWQGRFIDRRHLVELDWPVWAQTVAELKAKLTDAQIDEAVRALPPEWHARRGAFLAATLKTRRDTLEQPAEALYRLLLEEAEVHARGVGELIELIREDNGAVTVRSTAEGGVKTFDRRFVPDETREVRVYAKGGNDRIRTTGPWARGIRLRVIGGAGDDILDDTATGWTHFYDHEGTNQTMKGKGTTDSDKPFVHPLDYAKNPLRDWGRQTGARPWFSFGPDLGLIGGLELSHSRHGFRKFPYSSEHALRAGVASGTGGFIAEYEFEFQRTNSRKRGHLDLRFSEIDIVRFYGFGNETAAFDDTGFHKVEQRTYSVTPSFRLGVDDVDLWLHAIARYTDTPLRSDRIIGAVTAPYGSAKFGAGGIGADLTFDKRGERKQPLGLRFFASSTYFPELWDVEEDFGEVHGDLSLFIRPQILGLTLATRVGGKHIFLGRAPFQEAAFLGGRNSVRSLGAQRYAGDSMVFGNVEARFRLGTLMLLVPTEVGILALADAGRVWVDGEDSNRWHTAVGGGLWLSFYRPQNTIAIGAAHGRDGIRVYVQTGLFF